MVCADGQIHREESKALHELASQTQAGQNTIAEMEKILAQDEHRLSVEEVAGRIPPEQHSEAMRQILAVAYVDGSFSPLEREMVEQVARVWKWSAGEIQETLAQAEAFSTNRPIGTDSDQPKLSAGARLLRGAESILSRALVAKLAEFAPEAVGRRIVQLQREILLTGPDYDRAVRQCAAIALEDYKWTEVALQEASSALIHLQKTIQLALEQIQNQISSQGETMTAKEAIKQLEMTKEALSADIIKEIELLRESLQAKQRALNHFSIAFVGKTKAGKSTLHAIITGGGWEAIGAGGQRTTRFNRVYEWKNIRIIDTPGIGAPDSKTDAEIVQSVIEESDVICYVVTNDSIQETEFQFLKRLKEKAKPLIILLNVKHNLRDSRRLEYFLNDPNKLFAMDGKSGLGGHIERIHRYAKQHYANDYFEIVPVMLLAAQMASEPEHKEYKDKLFKASRIQDFLDSIRESLVKHGAIRRSQTLLGSTVCSVERPAQWVTQQIQIYQQLIETLKHNRQIVQHQIQAAGNDNLEALQQQIALIFQELLNGLPEFAADNWNFNEESLKRNWELKIKSINFDDRLQTAYQKTTQCFNRDVQEAIDAIGKELKMIAKLGGTNFNFAAQESHLYEQNLARIGGSFMRISKTLINSIVPPVNKTIMMGAFIINSLIGIFKNREQKRRFAVQRVSIILTPQIKERQREIMEKATVNFQDYYGYASQSINNYFDGLIQGLESVVVQLDIPQKKLEATAQALNIAYGKRIVDWCMGIYEPLTEQKINKTLTQVKRNFGYRFDIQTKFEVQNKLSQTDMNRILQEEVYLHRIQ